jgi:hypothetical protein
MSRPPRSGVYGQGGVAGCGDGQAEAGSFAVGLPPGSEALEELQQPGDLAGGMTARC